MRKLLIVDGNGIGYANQHGTKLTNGAMETQALFGMIKSMRALRETYIGYQIRVLWDGKAQWRFDLLPEYKANRSDDPKKVAVKESYQAQRPFIYQVLEMLGIPQVFDDDMEADDLAGYMVAKLPVEEEGRDVVLIAGDQDWAQLVRQGVSWQDPREKSRFINQDNFFSYTGYRNPVTFLEGKALQGDNSDNIPGVGGVGEKRACELIAEYGRVKNLYSEYDAGRVKATSKFMKNVVSKEGREAFMRNLRMMQLMKVPEPKNIKLVRSEVKPESFHDLCAEMNFGSILRDFDRFITPFERNIT